MKSIISTAIATAFIGGLAFSAPALAMPVPQQTAVSTDSAVVHVAMSKKQRMMKMKKKSKKGMMKKSNSDMEYMNSGNSNMNNGKMGGKNPM